MKKLILIIGFVFISIAVLATPIAIAIGLYDWVGNDAGFKCALWEGFKSWAVMFFSGLIIGIPCYFLCK